MSFARTSWARFGVWKKYCERRRRIPGPSEGVDRDEPSGSALDSRTRKALRDAGLFRYKLLLRDGSVIEMFEKFRIMQDAVKVTKYSFHWQDGTGRLRMRWDNAPHHPEVTTHPHHVHAGSETNVMPHDPVTVEEILNIIAKLIMINNK